MQSKHIIAVCLTGLLLTGSVSLLRADVTELKEKIAVLDKELAPIKAKAQADADVKAASEAVKAAQQKQAEALEAAMIKADPKAKELLDQRKKLMEEIAALRKAAVPPAEPKKKAPADK